LTKNLNGRLTPDAILAFTVFSIPMYFADTEHKTAEGRRSAITAAESLHVKLEAISGQPFLGPQRSAGCEVTSSARII
jgi:hypothetical protein